MVGLTQSELARQAEVSTELVSRIERGRCLPSLTTLVRFARALRTTPDELLGFDDGGSRDIHALVAVLQSLPKQRRVELHRIAEALASYERRPRPLPGS